MADKRMLGASARKFRVEITGMESLGGWFDPGIIGKGVRTTEMFDEPNAFPRPVQEERYCDPLRLWRRYDGNRELEKWANKAASDPRDGSLIWPQPDGTEIRENWTRGFCRYHGKGRHPETGVFAEVVEIVVEDLFAGQA